MSGVRKALVSLGALLALLLAGHFLADSLVPSHKAGPEIGTARAEWAALQGYFDDCLARPLPLMAWPAPAEAGVVVILRPAGMLDSWRVAACLAAPDLAVWAAGAGAVPWKSPSDDEVWLVTWCGTGDLDAASRERLAHEFRERFMHAARY